MAATLLPGLPLGQPHRLRLPDLRSAATPIEAVRHCLGSTALRGSLVLECGAWWLRLRELRAIQELLERQGLLLQRVTAQRAETLVAAAALGLETEAATPSTRPEPPPPAAATDLTIHRGTLRSGDHLQSEGSVLLLGDVNPGARISAGGHVLVWGRLRGMAHAGCHGDAAARITALQLHPVQLRIAEAVARGPEEAPAAGQAEEAHLVDGEIRIDPASPCWPLAC